jgi:hypothetical protein
MSLWLFVYIINFSLSYLNNSGSLLKKLINRVINLTITIKIIYNWDLCPKFSTLYKLNSYKKCIFGSVTSGNDVTLGLSAIDTYNSTNDRKAQNSCLNGIKKAPF